MKSPVDSKNLTTFKIGGPIKDLIFIRSDRDLKELNKPYIIIGSGSNIIFNDNLPDLVIAKMEIKGIKIIEENDEDITLSVGAGENWDKFVEFTVENNYSGVEALSGIPGTIGASPVQNIGAYGVEAKDTISEVRAYNTDNGEVVVLGNKECEFSYRDSIFKKNPQRWIIVEVFFKLKKHILPRLPDYKDVKNYFEMYPGLKINLQNIRRTIIEIRKNKLPDPTLIPNCGSFFKNPIISIENSEKIKEQFPNIPIFPFGDMVKASAGFLIEQSGFKGREIHNIVVYKNNALVLTNPKNASFSDLIEAKDKIQKTVFDKFGILLDTEVNIIK